MDLIVRLILAAILAFAGMSKLASPRIGAEAMATYGFHSRPLRWGTLGVVVLSELVLAVGISSGSDKAAYAAAALMGLFALALAGTVLQGRVGAPCGCFGSHSTVSGFAIARNAGLALALVAIPALPS